MRRLRINSIVIGTSVEIKQHQSTGAYDLKIIDLRTFEQTFAIRVRHDVPRVAWSPDGKRLFLGSATGGDVVDIAAKEIIAIGKVPSNFLLQDEMVWADPEGVYFFSPNTFTSAHNSSVVFDLGTLSSKPIVSLRNWRNNIADSLGVLFRQMRYPSTKENVELRTGNRDTRWFDVTASAFLYATNSDWSYQKFLQPLDARPMPIVSPTGEHVVVGLDATNGVSYSGCLQLLTLASRAAGPLSVSGRIAPIPEQASPTELAAIRASIGRGDLVLAGAYGSRVNPLNGRVVGVQGTAKSYVRITRLVGDTAFEGQIFSENGKTNVGDAISGFVTRSGQAFKSFGGLVVTIGNAALASDGRNVTVTNGVARQVDDRIQSVSDGRNVQTASGAGDRNELRPMNVLGATSATSVPASVADSIEILQV